MAIARRRADLVGILEAAYRVELPEETWIAGVLDATRKGIDQGYGVFGFTYDATNPSKFGFRTFVSRDIAPELLQLLQTMAQTITPDLVKTGIWARRASTMSEAPGWAGFTQRSGWLPAPDGVAPSSPSSQMAPDEGIAINALDPSGLGCLVGAAWKARRRLSPRERAVWSMVSTHLGAAFRLQRKLLASEQPVPTDAVLSPSGQLLHAEQPAHQPSVRDALSDACQSIERARTRRGRSDVKTSLSLWRSLVSERWTLVDTYESDGKRYVVARRNDVRLPRPDALSPRERQALGFAALGDSNKLIAYGLGISASTVRVLLHRAAAKLGCRSRADLLRRFRELALAPPGPVGRQ